MIAMPRHVRRVSGSNLVNFFARGAFRIGRIVANCSTPGAGTPDMFPNRAKSRRVSGMSRFRRDGGRRAAALNIGRWIVEARRGNIRWR